MYKSPRWWWVSTCSVLFSSKNNDWWKSRWIWTCPTFKLKNMNYTTCLCSFFRRENRHTHTKCVCCHGQHISPHYFFLFGCFELQLVFKIAALPLFTRRSVMILCNRLLLIFSLSRCLHVFSPIITISLQQPLLQTFQGRKPGSADQQKWKSLLHIYLIFAPFTFR